jgi:hypothetical protein
MKASSFVGDFAHAQILVKVQDPNYGRGSISSEKKKNSLQTRSGQK